jgi:predicted  nucleic acid-binding Zn-ribbon protein
MPAVRELFDLQAVDNEIGVRDARLSEIETALGDDTPLAPLRTLVAELTTSLQKATASQNELDGIVTTFNEKVEAAETRLYSGTVTNSRELEGLQADIVMIKRQREEQEELLLMALDEVEGTQSKVNKASSKLEGDDDKWQQEQASMTAEQSRLTSELTAHKGDRDTRAGKVPPPELALYEQVRKAHAGKAVARMRNNSCESCRVEVPTKQAQLVRTATSPQRCPNCGLILLAG